jgi:SpoVK/Ycf46/Vps4 family AAA+-type ATPase
VKVADCVTTNIMLPAAGFEHLWGAIVTEPEVKDRLANHVLLALKLRADVPFEVSAIHGLVLLYGPPGTGKTTLARAVGQHVAGLVAGGKVRLIEINPHGLMSSEHGQSQQKVMEILCEHVPALADDRKPTIVVLDEVESMVVARSAASLSANPADIHRATDAVLTAVDRNTADHPHIVIVATSNFTDALDEAFKSRADASILVPLPGQLAIEQILRDTLRGFGAKYKPLARLADDPELKRVARALVGIDGRRVRKVVTDAMAIRKECVVDPGKLRLEDLDQAVEHLGLEPQQKGGRHAAA